MKLNIVNLSNGYKTLLLEDIFPTDLLDQIHSLCAESQNDNSDWQYVEWSRLRKTYKGTNTTFNNIKTFLSSKQFIEPIEHIVGQKMILTDFSLWADYPGFGSLLAHRENDGQGQGQIFIASKEYSTNGTSFMNDKKQLLFTLPYRDNYGWYMDNCTKIMHSREFDVPKDIVRYCIVFWHNYQ